MFKVRLAEPEEEPRLQELEKILNLETPGLRSSETWVLDDDGKLIGMARITDVGQGYFLSSVGIIQQSRGKGLGRKLVLRLLEAKKSPFIFTPSFPDSFSAWGLSPALHRRFCPRKAFSPVRTVGQSCVIVLSAGQHGEKEGKLGRERVVARELVTFFQMEAPRAQRLGRTEKISGAQTA